MLPDRQRRSRPDHRAALFMPVQTSIICLQCDLSVQCKHICFRVSFIVSPQAIIPYIFYYVKQQFCVLQYNHLVRLAWKNTPFFSKLRIKSHFFLEKSASRFHSDQLLPFVRYDIIITEVKMMSMYTQEKYRRIQREITRKTNEEIQESRWWMVTWIVDIACGVFAFFFLRLFNII